MPSDTKEKDSLEEKYRKSDFDRHAGSALRRYRSTAGLSQTELSKECGIERSFITDIERGNKGFSFLTFVKICQETQPHIKSQNSFELFLQYLKEEQNK